jgi:ABC-type molybdate transport system substrate-binding protein
MLKKVADAKPGDIRVMVTAAMMGPIEAVRDQAEKIIGHPLYIEYGSARGNLKSEILNGQAFEVAILLPDVNAELLQQGKVVKGEYDVTSVKTAIALRGEANVDVSTPAALKKTLLGAAVVRYSPTGVAYPTVSKLLNDLDIKDSIKDASKSGAPIGPPGAQLLSADQYEINLFPLSEISRMKGVKNLGLVISPFQVPQHMSAVIGVHANDRKAAEALVKFLQSSVLDAPLKEAGMARETGG